MKPYERIELKLNPDVIKTCAGLIHDGQIPENLFPVILPYEVYKRYKIEGWYVIAFTANFAELRFTCVSKSGEVYIIYITGVVSSPLTKNIHENNPA